MVCSHVRFAVLAVIAIAVLATPVSAQLRVLTPDQVANLRARAEQGDVTVESLLDGATEVSGWLSWSCGARCKIGRGVRLDDTRALNWDAQHYAKTFHWIWVARGKGDGILRHNLVRNVAWRLSGGF
ncbi:MAG: hypothetical protein QF507_01970 [Vicinamibacterales bacterium]|jgi:hypothetical protein|nr:hypothetical protein [Vicinamibacterales bacterium]HJO18355.1 hypothetical protein [Vicinamibacterales bacterium]|tara:strand:- start:119822 stop:120202 length:381 start_codon:yes stop_codon:yes gene_type:complete